MERIASIACMYAIAVGLLSAWNLNCKKVPNAKTSV
jgi:hypothetical protein